MVPTVEEVLKLIAEYQQHDVLIAVDFKAEGVEQEVVRLAEKHKVLHKLLFIGRTITEPHVRDRIRSISNKAHTAAVANNAEKFPKAIAANAGIDGILTDYHSSCGSCLTIQQLADAIYSSFHSKRAPQKRKKGPRHNEWTRA